MQANLPRLELAARKAIVLLLVAATHGVSCHRDTPLAPETPAIPLTASVVSARYERVRPVTAGETGSVVLTLWYALVPGDPYNRTSPRLCILERTGDTTFVCSSPHFEAIPVGRRWSALVTDTAVSNMPVARDIYLNGTRIAVEAYDTGGESGVFAIDARGQVQ